MGNLTYTASRSLVPGHAAGDQFTLEIGITEATRTRNVDKVTLKSKGGAIETLRYAGSSEWQVTFQPVYGFDLDLLREALDSVEGGESFTLDLYGSAATPLNVKRTDAAYTEQPFMRRGGIRLDVFQVSVSVVEV